VHVGKPGAEVQWFKSRQGFLDCMRCYFVIWDSICIVIA
jgi:hypothetical protein